MRVVAKSTLKKFWEQPAYKDAESPLTSWYEEARKADWKTPQDIKDQYSHASLCKNNRVVFNIGGNKYRLVVQYPRQTDRIILQNKKVRKSKVRDSHSPIIAKSDHEPNHSNA